MAIPKPGLTTATTYLTPLGLAAAALALIVPSHAAAAGSDVLLAALVLLTALGISAAELAALHRHAAVIAALSVLPLLALGALGWALGRPFGAEVRHGLLGVGLASSEVAGVGLVALAGADAAVALGIVTGSLLAAAILSPLLIGLLAPGAHADGAALLGRFALVVILPLLIGVALRSLPAPGAWLARRDAGREGLAALAVAALIYAALSGAHGAHGLGAATAAGALFLAASALIAAVSMRFLGAAVQLDSSTAGRARSCTVRARPTAASAPPSARALAVPGAFGIGMRDFAVAATLATQAFGTAAATVPGTYGVLMLIGGSLAATFLRRAPGLR